MLDAAEIDRRANVLADQRMQEQTFQSRVSSIAQEGLKAHPGDWPQTIANLQRINALDQDMINVAHELGNSHEILYSLGKDMNEAARIASLPASQKGAALAVFASKLTVAARALVSGAPAPLPEGVGGSPPASSSPSDKDSMDEWARKRIAQRTGRAA